MAAASQLSQHAQTIPAVPLPSHDAASDNAMCSTMDESHHACGDSATTS